MRGNAEDTPIPVRLVMSKDARLVHERDRRRELNCALNLAAIGASNGQQNGTEYAHVWRLVTTNRVSAVRPAVARPGHGGARPRDGPGPEFKLRTDADEIFTSPDRQIRVEQYGADKGDEGFLFQFWTFDDKRRHASLLNAGEGIDLAGYPAGFRFSPEQPVAGAHAENRSGFSDAVSVPAERICNFPPPRQSR